jgi:glutathione S-transferase
LDLKIIYFNFPFWRAEVARIPLFIGNIPFEDKRVTSEEFSHIKEYGHMKDGTKIPFSQLPVLVVNGEVIAQTGAIARICGKLSGFYPEDMVAAGKVDQVIDAATDINMLLRPSMKEQDPIKKKEMRIDLSNNDLPRYFSYLDNLLENNSQWFVGNTMTIADIAIWRILGWLTSGVIDDIPKNLTDKFDNLNNLYSLVNNDTKIKEWVSKTYK